MGGWVGVGWGKKNVKELGRGEWWDSNEKFGRTWKKSEKKMR